MSDTDLPLVQSGETVNAIVDLATRAAGPQPLTPGYDYAVITPDGVNIIERDLDMYRNRPLRPSGTVTVETAAAFTDYCNRHLTPDTEIFTGRPNATRHDLQVVAVFNSYPQTSIDSPESTPAWCDHTLHLKLATSLEWQTWGSRDRKWMGQTEFAEFIEDNLANIVSPAAATMLEVAQSLDGSTHAEFKNAIRLDSGERRLAWTETTDARAGRNGNLDVPEQFSLALRPFTGVDPYRVNARFRWRIKDGVLSVCYLLNETPLVLEQAADEVCAMIVESIDAPVFDGLPPLIP